MVQYFRGIGQIETFLITDVKPKQSLWPNTRGPNNTMNQSESANRKVRKTRVNKLVFVALEKKPSHLLNSVLPYLVM